MSAKESRRNVIPRGTYKPVPLGTVTFVGLRLLDVYIQYRILADGIAAPLLAKVGLKAIEEVPPIQTGVGFIDALGLSPYRLILFTMSVGSSLKQIFWATYINRESFHLKTAAMVAVMNTITNGLNNIAGTTSLFSSSMNGLSLPLGVFKYQPLSVVVGSAFYLIGLFGEATAELQRKRFKDNLRNAGKCYTGGLWSITRHVNYTCYTAWRGGNAMAAAGWTWGIGMGAMTAWDFSKRAIPELDEYCTKRYGEQWDEFKRKTPYEIIPGLW